MLWGLFPNGSHLFVYFILLYKIQFLLVHECQQKPNIVFYLSYFKLCCGDCSPWEVFVFFLFFCFVFFLLLYKVQVMLVDEANKTLYQSHITWVIILTQTDLFLVQFRKKKSFRSILWGLLIDNYLMGIILFSIL